VTARAQTRSDADHAAPRSAEGAAVDAGQTMSFADGLGVHGVQMFGGKGKAASESKEEKKDLGMLEGLGAKFQHKAGALADKVAPEAGRTGRITIFSNIPVAAGGLVKVSFKFMDQVLRGDDGKVTMKMTVGGGVTAGKEIDLYFATVKAFAAAQVFGYIEAKGDSGEECFRLMALGIHSRLSKVNKKLANAVISADTVKVALANMDEDEYVETGLGVEVAIGGGGEVHPDQQAGGWAYGSAQKGERLTKGEDGELKADEYSQKSVSLGCWLPPFRAMGSLTSRQKGGKPAGVDANVSGVAMMSIGDLEGRILGGTFALDMLSRLGKELRKAGKKAAKGGDGAISEQMADEMVAKSATKFVVGQATHAAIKSLNSDYGGMAIGFALSIDATWTPGADTEITLSLQKQDRIDIGKSFRDDLLMVRLESLQDIFKVEI